MIGAKFTFFLLFLLCATYSITFSLVVWHYATIPQQHVVFAPTPPTTRSPTHLPTIYPSRPPTTSHPSKSPTLIPTRIPTLLPTIYPTMFPTTSHPSKVPTLTPTRIPTTSYPSKVPTTSSPTKYPTKIPTLSPGTTHSPTRPTTMKPSSVPSAAPTCVTPVHADILFIIDGSASVFNIGGMPNITSFLISFLSSPRERMAFGNMRVGIIEYSGIYADTPARDIDFTSYFEDAGSNDLATITTKLEGLIAYHGTTNTSYALQLARESFFTPENRRPHTNRVVVLISDGNPSDQTGTTTDLVIADANTQAALLKEEDDVVFVFLKTANSGYAPSYLTAEGVVDYVYYANGYAALPQLLGTFLCFDIPIAPSHSPTTSMPTTSPSTHAPTASPTTSAPTSSPTTSSPTSTPTASAPTVTPTTSSPTPPTTHAPSTAPSPNPTVLPTKSPTHKPTTFAPSRSPTTCTPGVVTCCLVVEMKLVELWVNDEEATQIVQMVLAESGNHSMTYVVTFREPSTTSVFALKGYEQSSDTLAGIRVRCSCTRSGSPWTFNSVSGSAWKAVNSNRTLGYDVDNFDNGWNMLSYAGTVLSVGPYSGTLSYLDLLTGPCGTITSNAVGTLGHQQGYPATPRSSYWAFRATINQPSRCGTDVPVHSPTVKPSHAPTIPTIMPTSSPSRIPSISPSFPSTLAPVLAPTPVIGGALFVDSTTTADRQENSAVAGALVGLFAFLVLVTVWKRKAIMEYVMFYKLGRYMHHSVAD